MEACQVRTNADITIYNHYVTSGAEAYAMSQIAGVAWENRKASNTLAVGGRIKADQATIYIPMARDANYKDPQDWQDLADKTGYWTIQPGDLIVRGIIPDEISASLTPSDLKRTYNDVLVISSVDKMDNGSRALQHWKVSAG